MSDLKFGKVKFLVDPNEYQSMYLTYDEAMAMRVTEQGKCIIEEYIEKLNKLGIKHNIRKRIYRWFVCSLFANRKQVRGSSQLQNIIKET